MLTGLYIRKLRDTIALPLNRIINRNQKEHSSRKQKKIEKSSKKKKKKLEREKREEIGMSQLVITFPTLFILQTFLLVGFIYF